MVRIVKRMEDTVLEALYVPDDDRTFIRKPFNLYPAPSQWSAGDVEAVVFGRDWLVSEGHPDTLASHYTPLKRTKEWRLRSGVVIPDTVLPSTVTGFYDEDDADPIDGYTEERWRSLYEQVTETYTPDPKTWTVSARSVTWGLDAPGLINDLAWQLQPGAYGDATFAIWRAGYLDGCRKWAYKEIDELKIPGVEVLSSSDVIHVRAMIPGKTQRAATYTASGRKRRATVERQLWTTFRVSPNIPQRVAGLDLLAASLKLREIVAQVEADVREVGAVACPRCNGNGWLQNGKGEAS